MKTYCRAFIRDGQIQHLMTSDRPIGDEMLIADDSGELECVDFEHRAKAFRRARDLRPKVRLKREKGLSVVKVTRS